MTRVFDDVESFTAAVGEELGVSDWVTVTQERIDAFAEATGDRQWIHVDPERAADGPFGTTVAHGYLVLSLLPALAQQVYEIDGLTMAINYGADKVRFPHPVPVGSRVRAGATLVRTEKVALGTRAVVTFAVEIEGVDKPACVADVVYVMA